ncbi:unnamed protein product [Lactuca virosa]|uniref:non-specific serine/threonine protein kinase n=1 Tax=Lactuca virosa TaxID=75947 RepID=A0AAU9MY54_9ASTR|nr:unnamed protein product [Lactuca virosa]
MNEEIMKINQMQRKQNQVLIGRWNAANEDRITSAENEKKMRRESMLEYDDDQELYIRMSTSQLTESQFSFNKNKGVLAVVLSVSIAALLLSAVAYACRKKVKRLNKKGRGSRAPTLDKDHTSVQMESLDELPFFSLHKIAEATNNFNIDNKIGEGGFGPVYKGVLENGRVIAVKRLSETSHQGLDEFQNEVICIAKLQHQNLVKLLGYCIHGNERILIYEYMENKSLDSFLFDETKGSMLDWPRRFRIIHGNILLDSEMNPKISDFGLARKFVGQDAMARTKKVVETHGYISPEYAVHGRFSIKSDVFISVKCNFPPPTVPCTLCVPLAPTPPSNPQPPPPISTPSPQPDDTNFISSPQSTSSEDSLPDNPHPSSSSSPTSPHSPPSPPTHGHPMITRAKAGIFRPNHRADISYVHDQPLPSALFASRDPTHHSKAMGTTEWLRAMQSEIFGVVVLEIVSGKKNRGFSHEAHSDNLLGHNLLTIFSINNDHGDQRHPYLYLQLTHSPLPFRHQTPTPTMELLMTFSLLFLQRHLHIQTRI